VLMWHLWLSPLTDNGLISLI